MRFVGTVFLLSLLAVALADSHYATRHEYNLKTRRVMRTKAAKADVLPTPTPSPRVRDDPKPVWSENLQYAIYTSTLFARGLGKTDFSIGSGDWLNPPYQAVVYKPTGQRIWTNTIIGNKTELVDIKLVTARHIEKEGPTPATKDVVVAGWLLEEEFGQGTKSCVLNGFLLNSVGEARPIWQYNISQCLVDFLDSIDMMKLSDDGTTVAVMVETNSTLPQAGADSAYVTGKDPQLTLQIHVLNAVTGKLLYAYSPSDVTPELASRGIAITARGEYVVASVGGNSVYVIVLE